MACFLGIDQDDRRDAAEYELRNEPWVFCNRLPYPVQLYLFSSRKGITDLIGGVGARSVLKAKITRSGILLEKGDSVHVFYADSRPATRGVLYEILRSGKLRGDMKNVDIGGVGSKLRGGGLTSTSLERPIYQITLENHITIPMDVYLISSSDSTAMCQCPKKCPPEHRGWERTSDRSTCDPPKLECTRECRGRRKLACLDSDTGFDSSFLSSTRITPNNNAEGFAVGDQLLFVFSHDQAIYGSVTITHDTGTVVIGLIRSSREDYGSPQQGCFGADAATLPSLPFRQDSPSGYSRRKIFKELVDTERTYGL